MRASVGWTAAALAAIGVGAPASQERAGGSAVPCAVPLAWRVARVDPEFGLGHAAAVQALLDAMATWEDAFGGDLFVYDSVAGYPIRLVYDERQAFTEEVGRRNARLAEARERLDVRHAALVRRGEAHTAARSRYAAAARAYEARLGEHNEEVRGWNAAGGAPPDVAERLIASGAELESLRAELAEVRRALEAEAAAISAEEAELRRAEEEYLKQAETWAAEIPEVAMEAGQYREAIRTEKDSIVSIGREIRIYRFAGADELRLVLAHELGHALGLGHADDPAALMSAVREVGPSGAAAAGPHAEDLALLRAVCPRLAGAG